MTNREWLINEMQNMSDEELVKNVCLSSFVCVAKDSMCREINCGSTNCKEYVINWLKSEHKEPIKLSDAERVILENIIDDYEWIARDNGGNIHVFKYKPTKSKNYWNSTSSYSLCAFNHLFQFIKWEDAEPYEIAELLKGE